MDLFKEPVPNFNIKGRDKVASLSGTIFSLFVITTMILYATVKFLQLKDRDNPNIASFIEEGVNTDREHGLNLSELNFMFAWSVEGFIDK